ncbi:MAG TPA: hypothetical protein VI112_16150, partial [Bacteroidia bacterium]
IDGITRHPENVLHSLVGQNIDKCFTNVHGLCFSNFFCGVHKLPQSVDLFSSEQGYGKLFFTLKMPAITPLLIYRFQKPIQLACYQTGFDRAR